MTDLPIDEHPLVELAGDVLAREDFYVRRLRLPEAHESVVAAEDEYSLAAIVAANDWDEVRRRVFPVDVALANWVAEHGEPAKRWDVYLVCLVQRSLADPAEFAEAEQLEADTRRVRKYVRDGVLPEEEEVRKALAPFLRLDFTAGVSGADPLSQLERKLRGRGISDAVAKSAIGSFLATGAVKFHS